MVRGIDHHAVLSAEREKTPDEDKTIAKYLDSCLEATSEMVSSCGELIRLLDDFNWTTGLIPHLVNDARSFRDGQIAGGRPTHGDDRG
jgi:hypothetical protein